MDFDEYVTSTYQHISTKRGFPKAFSGQLLFLKSTWTDLANFSVARGAAASKSWRVVEELLDTGENDLVESAGCAMSSPSRDSFNDIGNSLDASAVGVLSGDHGD
jgi:hypothetical protein